MPKDKLEKPNVKDHHTELNQVDAVIEKKKKVKSDLIKKIREIANSID